MQQITRQFNAGTQKRVSSHIINNYLRDMGYRSHRLTRVPLLTTHRRMQHLSWNRKYRHWTWTLELWENVALTDESRFILVHADSRVRVRRKPHKAIDSSYQKSTFQAGEFGILLRGLFTWTEMVCVVRVTSSVTGYCHMHDDHELPFVRNIPL